MWIEHLIYTAAIAIIIGMVLQHYKKPDISWVLIPMSAIPDIDYPISKFMTFIGFKYPYIINHGDFHNLIGLFVISSLSVIYLNRKILGGWLLIGIMCVSGFAIHLFEDVLVYDHIYSVLYPITIKVYGWNLIPETGNLIIGGTNVFIVGFICVAIALLTRVALKGDDWIDGYYNDFHKWRLEFLFHPYSLAMKTYMIILLNQINTFKYTKDE